MYVCTSVTFVYASGSNHHVLFMVFLQIHYSGPKSKFNVGLSGPQKSLDSVASIFKCYKALLVNSSASLPANNFRKFATSKSTPPVSKTSWSALELLQQVRIDVYILT